MPDRRPLYLTDDGRLKQIPDGDTLPTGILPSSTLRGYPGIAGKDCCLIVGQAPTSAVLVALTYEE